MKKITTLFLLFVFLLNVLGWYGVFMGLKFSNSMQTMRNMDENRYATQDEITFSIPLTVPYYTDPSGEYRRVDGEFQHRGEVYRMVKQKLFRDTLYVVCLKDKVSKNINDAISDYVKTFSDKPSDAKQQTVKTISFLKDYYSTSVSVESGHRGWSNTLSFFDCENLYRHHLHDEIFSPPKTPLVG